MKLHESLATEIRSFYSLRDLKESIEEEIRQYEAVADEYSQWLGSFLRDMQEIHGNEEWFKELSTLQKSLKEKARKETRRKKAKQTSTTAVWVSYKGVMLSASEQGEAEILFDALEEINKIIEQLTKVKNTIENLERSSLGKDVIYIVYFRNGVPEKIVLRHKREREFMEKFKFTTDFSILKEVYP
jgi:hypothetical protein